MRRTCYSLLVAALVVPAVGVRAQAALDTSAIGGPEEPVTYEELGGGELIDAAAPSEDWDAEDSLAHIPSYAIYGDWNTDAIFHRRDALKDSVTLTLATCAADHYMPVCGHVTSPFGPRHGRMHYGTDLKLRHGDPVGAAFDGMVRISRYHKQFGNVVVIRHANGLETLYGHLSERLVETGDMVKAGQPIGLGGSTGRSTGDHLHFETRYLGQPIDPQLLFDVEQGELKANTLHLNADMFEALAKANAAVAAKSRTKKFHTVRRGDTLSSISRRYGVSVTQLTRMNHLPNSNRLRPGQRVRYN
ncbi:MAG: M23 family metallopeptidase [Flavobacteriales bacterium]